MTRSDARRMTSEKPPEGTTLFLIGMSRPRLRGLGAWLYTFTAMPAMLLHLRKNRDAGMLSARLYLGSSLMVVSYWRSAEDLRVFAAHQDGPHLRKWRGFVKRYADANKVGLWHETYVIGRHETIGSGMAPWGLAEAVGWRPIGAGQATAAQRLAA